MKLMEFECQNCGARIYRRSVNNRGAIIGTLRSVQKEMECCDDPDYRDKQGILRHIRESSVAGLY